MISEMSFHHIGYAVPEISCTASHYVDAGWSLSSIVDDPYQKCKIAFLRREGFPTIELVEQFDKVDNGGSSLNSFLKNGVTPYHICYEVHNIYDSISELRKQKYLLLFNPVPAAALDDRLICYMMHPQVGLIELLQR